MIIGDKFTVGKRSGGITEKRVSFQAPRDILVFLGRILEMVDPEEIHVYGEASDNVGHRSEPYIHRANDEIKRIFAWSSELARLVYSCLIACDQHSLPRTDSLVSREFFVPLRPEMLIVVVKVITVCRTEASIASIAVSRQPEFSIPSNTHIVLGYRPGG